MTEHTPGGELAAFTSRLDFELDGFQRVACEQLAADRGVLVCAPTGAGKTIVGEFAVHLALTRGSKCFYTTPIKALSNQKYHDLAAVHGSESVGLLTGDNSINSAAPVVVMTTEVLRNMIYADSAALHGLTHVVMDEVHYLADRFRGAVWEEVILGLDPGVRIASLSATVSNAEEFGDWMETVRGDTAVIVDEHRPVPLHQHMLVGNRLFEVFARQRGDGKREVNPELVRFIRNRMLIRSRDDERGAGRGRGGRGQSSGRSSAISRPNVIRLLEADGLRPAITFIFSRAGCDGAVSQCLRSDLNLLEPAEAAKVTGIVDANLGDLSHADAEVLGVEEWRAGLARGFAAHHAGMLPRFRETVEELFTAGLVKVVFATETLALGINMPARSVVLERLIKYNGEAHVDLTPGEYTQLTGRAGRRGIDTEGHAVVCWSPEVVPERVAGLAGARTFPLRSSFAPEYNMALNLIDRLGVAGSRDLLRASFAQFQTDRSVVGLARRLDRARRDLRRVENEVAAAAAGLGVEPEGFLDYMTLREDIRRREREVKFARREADEFAVSDDLASLQRGQVIAVSSRGHRGLAVVLDPAQQREDPRPLVLSEDGWSGRVGAHDFVNPPEVLGSLRIPKNADIRSGRGRRELASALRSSGIERPRGRPGKRRKAGDDPQLVALRKQLRAHPAHDLPGGDELVRLAQQRNRVLRDVVGLEESMSQRSSQLENDFTAIAAVLTELGYLEPAGAGDAGEQELAVTPTGAVLSRIYCEQDLLVAECIRGGAWDDLNPAELAAVVSAMVYESRRDSYTGGVDSLPGHRRLRDAMNQTMEIWATVGEVQQRHGVQQLSEPDTGFCAAVLQWASGRSLTDALLAAGARGNPLSPGDFVRWNRQVIDLLEQVRLSLDPAAPLAGTAKRAANAIRRGVVAVELA